MTIEPLPNSNNRTDIATRAWPRWPDFIHVGPPRTGTTWLYEVLAGHAALPSLKETHFFEAEYHRGIDWYFSLFGSSPSSLPVGEITPTYFSNAVARDRIKRHIPDCKIICTFREPAERLYSLYHIARFKRERVPDTFESYWRAIVDGGSDLNCYASQLREWQAAFGESNMLVLFYEDLVSDPQGYLDRICDFTGVERVELSRSPVGHSRVFSAPAAARSNTASRFAVRAIDWVARHGGKALVQLGKQTRIRKRIRARFVADFEPLSQSMVDELRSLALSGTEELERMTGRDLSGWKPGGQSQKTRIKAVTRSSFA
jgi:hypothetical protein